MIWLPGCNGGQLLDGHGHGGLIRAISGLVVVAAAAVVVVVVVVAGSTLSSWPDADDARRNQKHNKQR